MFVQSTFEDVRHRAISVTYVAWWRAGPAIQDIKGRDPLLPREFCFGDWDPDTGVPTSPSPATKSAGVEMASPPWERSGEAQGVGLHGGGVCTDFRWYLEECLLS